MARFTRRREAPPRISIADLLGESPHEEIAQDRTAPPLPAGEHYIWGTGRRKRAVARVRIRPGSGQILINKRPANEYFPSLRDQNSAVAPLMAIGMASSWDVWVNVGGGGMTGQAEAVSLGVARALIKAVPELEGTLRSRNLLTRDARKVERKKYGQPGARRRFQFSKR
ncbi:MAG: 30S ribosomal protein S9 [Planctomycetota bacterium]|jgi:small subunit ribosomal protein S9